MGREERGGGTPRRRRRPRAAAVDLAEEAVRGGRGRNGGARCEPRVFLFGVDFLFGVVFFFCADFFALLFLFYCAPITSLYPTDETLLTDRLSLSFPDI